MLKASSYILTLSKGRSTQPWTAILRWIIEELQGSEISCNRIKGLAQIESIQ